MKTVLQTLQNVGSGPPHKNLYYQSNVKRWQRRLRMRGQDISPKAENSASGFVPEIEV